MSYDEAQIRLAVRHGTDPATRPTREQVDAIAALTYDVHAIKIIKRMLERRLDPKAYVTAEAENTMLMLRSCLCTASDEFVRYAKSDLTPLITRFYRKERSGNAHGIHRAARSLLDFLGDEASLAKERRSRLPIKTNSDKQHEKHDLHEKQTKVSQASATGTLPMTPPDTPSLQSDQQGKISFKADNPTRVTETLSPKSRFGGLATPKDSPSELPAQLAPASSHESVIHDLAPESSLIEDKVRSVTANTPPPITMKQMNEVADMTYEPLELNIIREVMDMRLHALKFQQTYHHLVKTLTLVHHCLFQASDEFVELCRQRRNIFEKLRDFRCPNSDVRSRAEAVLSRLKDEERLQKERKSRKALSNGRGLADQSDSKKSPKPLTTQDPLTPLTRRYSLADEDGATMPLVEKLGEHAVGFGGYSDVWKGKLTLDHGATFTLVAVKILRLGPSSHADPDRLHKRLEREVRVWRLLNHESIANFHGVVYSSKKAPAIISSWYENGSADIYLQQHPNANPMKILWEIILGIEYLHDNDVVHGDLKGGNVMVDESGHAKLIDFGLSRLIDSVAGASGLTTSSVAFSIRWCAPELVKSDDSQTTKATDIYAFASTALQLLTGNVPYSSLKDRTVLVTVIRGVTPRKLSSGLRYNVQGADRIWSLLESCWKEASLRPTISEVKGRMRSFYR